LVQVLARWLAGAGILDETEKLRLSFGSAGTGINVGSDNLCGYSNAPSEFDGSSNIDAGFSLLDQVATRR
jgi:hypothetical protein